MMIREGPGSPSLSGNRGSAEVPSVCHHAVAFKHSRRSLQMLVPELLRAFLSLHAQAAGMGESCGVN